VASVTRLIYWLCIAVISVTSLTILLSGWWIGQRYSEEVARGQISRADYFLDAYLKSEEALHTTAVRGIITDFGFRHTVADGDPATIASMLDNHAQRVGLDLLLITDREGHALSSFGTLMDEDQNGRLFELLKDTPQTPRIIALKNGFYWLYLSAIKAPHIVGYAIAGTAIDINKLEHIQSITGLDLTLHSDAMGYTLTTNNQIENQSNETDAGFFPGPWERQRFISRQIPIQGLPAGDVSLFMTADLSEFHHQFDHFSFVMLVVTGLLVTVITVISLLFSKRIFTPFESLQRKLQHRASYDHLTGIQNRFTANEQFYRLLSESKRKENAFFVALIDIDHFKKINDTFGHSAGDMVLAEVAHRLKSCLREYDVLGRYGGEEFIVASSLSLAGCEASLLRLKNKISAKPFQHRDQLSSLTISIGASHIDFQHFSSMITPQALLEWADQALYEAKSQGRNQIVIKTCREDSLESRVIH
jgi:diguanylate cyclase (GGDEF)-like protein